MFVNPPKITRVPKSNETNMNVTHSTDTSIKNYQTIKVISTCITSFQSILSGYCCIRKFINKDLRFRITQNHHSWNHSTNIQLGKVSISNSILDKGNSLPNPQCCYTELHWRTLLYYHSSKSCSPKRLSKLSGIFIDRERKRGPSEMLPFTLAHRESKGRITPSLCICIHLRDQAQFS